MVLTLYIPLSSRGNGVRYFSLNTSLYYLRTKIGTHIKLAKPAKGSRKCSIHVSTSIIQSHHLHIGENKTTNPCITTKKKKKTTTTTNPCIPPNICFIGASLLTHPHELQQPSAQFEALQTAAGKKHPINLCLLNINDMLIVANSTSSRC